MSNLFLKVNGVKYEGFKELSYSRSIELASGEFNFVSTLDDTNILPFKVQEECQILFGDIELITGFIERMTFEYSSNSHQVVISGRDKTADIIDSTIVGDIDLSGQITLKQVLDRVIDEIFAGVDESKRVNVIDTTDETIFTSVGRGVRQILDPFSENEKVTAEVGENAFEFMEKYARKRGVLLSSNGRGDLLITRGGDASLSGAIINQVNGVRNNIKSASISYDLTRRYRNYVVRSQGNPSTSELINVVGLASIKGISGAAIDTVIRGSRTLELQAESTSVQKTDRERALWEANIRRARSVVYTCVLSSLNPVEGQIFVPNVLIRVIDEFSNINSQMLIRSVDYNFSVSGGTTVSLELVPPDAYRLEATRDVADVISNRIGNDVIAPQN